MLVQQLSHLRIDESRQPSTIVRIDLGAGRRARTVTLRIPRAQGRVLIFTRTGIIGWAGVGARGDPRGHVEVAVVVGPEIDRMYVASVGDRSATDIDTNDLDPSARLLHTRLVGPPPRSPAPARDIPNGTGRHRGPFDGANRGPLDGIDRDLLGACGIRDVTRVAKMNRPFALIERRKF